MPKHLKTREISELVRHNLTRSPYRWRTARGISKDIGVPISSLIEHLENSNEVVRAKKPNSSGQALYGSRTKIHKTTPFISRIIGAAINEEPE